MCSPSSGGALRASGGVALIRIGLRTSFALAPLGCGKSTCMPRARTCSSSNTSARSLIGPHGTPSASSASSHSRFVRVFVIAATIGTSVSRWRTRAGFVAKRSSSASSGRPPASTNLRNWPSLPTATMIQPSLVSNVWYGTMFGCALPQRTGGLPLARKFVFMFARSATCTSRSAMSMCWPSPVRSRCASAARIAIVEYRPVARSAIATPAFCGPPPGRPSRSPVMLMKPPIPWMMKS
ncbi:Uncharacterised protein [Burkholderia pseudomallei]|nr:Uncharacterised protein [Burkholderia pseudomallei]